MEDDTLLHIDEQYLQLEREVTQLRKNLRHWQTLEIDYEGLKEEFERLPDDTSYDHCLRVGQDFKAVLVDDEELRTLLKDKSGYNRRPLHIVETLAKRIEYVSRNVSTIRRQLSGAEKRRNTLLLAQDSDHPNDAGLPLGEILEKLDDDGRVISGKVVAPGGNAIDLINVLQKAGMPKFKDNVLLGTRQQLSDKVEVKGGSIEAQGVSLISDTVMTSVDNQYDSSDSIADDDELSASDQHFGPINFEDTEEDAELRREMLQYGMSEVGAIVAELDLAEAADDFENEADDDYLSDYDEDEDLYEDESEDEKGQTKNPLISQRYKRQMEALSKKHDIAGMKNIGPEPAMLKNETAVLNRPPAAEAARKAAIARDDATRSASKPTSSDDAVIDDSQKKKKKVAFAPSLDIAEEKPIVFESQDSATTVPPIEEKIVERSAGQSAASSPPSSLSAKPSIASAKPSRFKMSRVNPADTTPPPSASSTSQALRDPSNATQIPSGPPKNTISPILVEHPPMSNNLLPTSPDVFDEELHKQEIAIEYQKLRNRRINASGGYVHGGEDENYGEAVVARPEELVDERTGQPKKISRFKAARMKP